MESTIASRAGRPAKIFHCERPPDTSQWLWQRLRRRHRREIGAAAYRERRRRVIPGVNLELGIAPPKAAVVGACVGEPTSRAAINSFPINRISAPLPPTIRERFIFFCEKFGDRRRRVGHPHFGPRRPPYALLLRRTPTAADGRASAYTYGTCLPLVRYSRASRKKPIFRLSPFTCVCVLCRRSTQPWKNTPGESIRMTRRKRRWSGDRVGG